MSGVRAPSPEVVAARQRMPRARQVRARIVALARAYRVACDRLEAEGMAVEQGEGGLARMEDAGNAMDEAREALFGAHPHHPTGCDLESDQRTRGPLMDQLLTTAEAATRLGISAPRMRHYVRAGRLPATKHGRDWLIKAGDLERLERRSYRRQGAGARRAASPHRPS